MSRASVEHAGVGVELLRRVLDPLPRQRLPEPLDRGVAGGVAEAREHRDQGGQGIGRGAAEDARVERPAQRAYGHHEVGDAAQRGGQGRQAEFEVAGVGDHHRLRGEQVRIALDQCLEAARPLLLGALGDHLDADRQLVPERPQGGEVGDDVALAVGRAAPVPAAVLALGQLEGRGLPLLLGERRDDVVVAVEEDGRGARRGGTMPDHGLAAVGGLVGGDLGEADAGEGVQQPARGAVAFLRREFGGSATERKATSSARSCRARGISCSILAFR